jgi:hypothetical protein
MAVFDEVLRFAHENAAYANYSSEIDFMYIKKGGLSGAVNYVNNCTKPQVEVMRELSEHLYAQVPNTIKNRYVKRKPLLRLALVLWKRCPRLFICFSRFFGW